MSLGIRRTWLGIAAAAGALFLAALAAFILAPDGHFAIGVESASSAASALAQRPSQSLPRIYALFAGMVAAFNPCGFALLPAYLGLYLQDDRGRRRSIATTISTPLKVSLSVTAAFVAVFGLVGLAVGVAGTAISSVLPLVGFIIGVVLIVVGGAVLSGWSLDTASTTKLADRLGPAAGRTTMSGYFAYGIAYALASLGCTFPVFLTVLGLAPLAGGLLGGLLQFLLYGIGMAVVLAVLTIAAALFKTELLRRLRGVGRIIEPAGAILLLLVGAYVVYYWVTLGGLFRGTA